MINNEKLKTILTEYKRDFPERWNVEKYKWQAVKWFQDHWDINAPNFGEMFAVATEKTGNLFTFRSVFVSGMINEFAQVDDEATRAMFINLFDESKDLSERIEKFMADANFLWEKYNQGHWQHHYQVTSSITSYLWLMYPDKYYIYKYEICKTIAKLLGSRMDFKVARKGKAGSVVNGIKLYDAICEQIKVDEELISLFKSSLTEDCYNDPQFKTLTIDVGYYISKVYATQHDTTQEQDASVIEETAEDDSNMHYWWLNANPNTWSFNNIGVGEMVEYTLYNDNGNKRRIYQNFVAAKDGDLVIGYESTPIKQIVALSKVQKASDGTKVIFEKIEGLSNPIDLADFKDATELQNMEYLQNPQGSLFKLTKDEYTYLMDIIRDKNPRSKINSDAEQYERKDFLKDVFMSKDNLEDLLSLIQHKQNIILQGPPGVGKTYAAKRLAYVMMHEVDKDRIKFIQFHQNSTYEDFVMGYKPRVDGDGFFLKEGIFYNFCIKANNDPDRPYFFVIDEINRGNISKIFGELLMLIEKDYRGERITITYNDVLFAVPKNLYIIGLMNTADRSLAMIDYALRRRFSFFEMQPGFDSDGFKKYQGELHNEHFDKLISHIQELNEDIKKDDSLGDGFCIGRSYFCNCKQDDCTDAWMKEIIQYDILPTLREYWFDDKHKVEHWSNILLGVFNG